MRLHEAFTNLIVNQMRATDFGSQLSNASLLLFHLVQASLTYAEAQMRIDDTSKNDDITKSLRGLNKLAKILKRRRIEKG